MKSESKVLGLVIETSDKLVYIKHDVVRSDRNWESWGFDQLVKELREWLKCNKPPEVTAHPRVEIKFAESRTIYPWKGKVMTGNHMVRSKVRDVYSVISHTCLQNVMTSKRVGNILRTIAYVLIVGTNFIKLGLVKNKGARSVRKGTLLAYMMIHILYE